jgi:hypothetical protein
MGDGARFLDTPLPSPITEFVCLVTSNANGAQNYASGTAAIVGPNLAFCARHVLDEHWQLHEGRRISAGNNPGQFSFVLVQLVENRLNLWTATEVWTSGATDIAAFYITPASDNARGYTFRRPVLELMPPLVGERIRAFGYHSNEVSLENGEIVLRQAASTALGTVLEVHDEYRDRSRMPFPCFRTNARFDGGMSGGPVFNEAGHLCGLICSSLPASSPGEEHASYAASLWPAMAIVVRLDRPGYPPGTRYPLLELACDGTLGARNADRITLGEWSGTDTPRISIRDRLR